MCGDYSSVYNYHREMLKLKIIVENYERENHDLLFTVLHRNAIYKYQYHLDYVVKDTSGKCQLILETK